MRYSVYIFKKLCLIAELRKMTYGFCLHVCLYIRWILSKMTVMQHYSDIEGGEPSEEWKVPSFISKGIVDVCTYVNENKNR